MEILDLLIRRRAASAQKGGGGGDLPSGYTKYDWVQADSTTGCPNIDTSLALSMSTDWRFEGKFAKAGSPSTNWNQSWIFSRFNDNVYYANFAIGKYQNKSSQICFNYNARANNDSYGGDVTGVTINSGEWHTFVLRAKEDVSQGGALELDGAEYSYTRANTQSDSSTTLKIWPPNKSAQTTTYPCRFAEFKIYYNGALVADLVPAKRDADSVVGFYDVVRDLFLTPSVEGVTLLCGYGFEDFTV